MAISRAQRRADRRERVMQVFGEKDVEAALDLLELVEYAWHDRYGEVSPSEDVVDDILIVSRGRAERLISAGLLAVKDWRDLRVAADDLRR